MSSTNMFFAGVATSVVLIGMGFSGGVLLGKAAVDAPQNWQAVAAQNDVPAPARVVLPTSETTLPTPAPTVQAAATPAPAPQTSSEPAPELIPVKDEHQDAEKAKQSARHAEAEKQKAAKKAADRERHKRYAAQKARQEAARKQEQQEEQQQHLREQQQQEATKQAERPRIFAYDREDTPPQQVGFFGAN